MDEIWVWGLFVKGKSLVAQYEFTDEGYKEAVEDAEFATQETEVEHTVKQHPINYK